MRPVGSKHHRCLRFIEYRVEGCGGVRFCANGVDALVGALAAGHFF
jgi:hypothetical protein